MTPIAEESLKFHYEKRGKIEVISTVRVDDAHDLSVAYTPGVAQPCLEIQKDVNKSYELTRRWNLCLVVTDGTAVLGLGDIGPEAGMPVMEGKCALFKQFAGVDAFPLCIRSHDVDEIVRTVQLIAGSFGGVNLEDISAPRCFEIEKRLKECCDIPVFHDDQHGTAVVTLAGLTNALKVVGKRREEVKVVLNGAGAAGLGGSDGRLWLMYGSGSAARGGSLTAAAAGALAAAGMPSSHSAKGFAGSKRRGSALGAAAAAAAGYAAIYIVLCLSLAAWAFSKREF